ncbi:hypothetical protein [Eleftheria terrae]|uniref:hypothetical protein n=1 Tax=Eleftheria terrae TaxID=1597781 RepID=UPI00263A8091|nr:hypothetical protein [Eleftheria terrae]WKB50552.1 hypothetical protein N7L95_00090 [Eleftheria terrae]
MLRDQLDPGTGQVLFCCPKQRIVRQLGHVLPKALNGRRQESAEDSLVRREPQRRPVSPAADPLRVVMQPNAVSCVVMLKQGLPKFSTTRGGLPGYEYARIGHKVNLAKTFAGFLGEVPLFGEEQRVVW